MRKIIYALLSALSATVLVGGYYFSLHQTEGPPIAIASVPSPELSETPEPTSSMSGSAKSEDSGAQASAGTPATDTPLASSSLRNGTFTGNAVQTKYGAVQVSITVAGGKITDVQVPQYPEGDGREHRINTRAVPQLIDETLAAQSANIDMVSGATYTLSGYQASLQSALDQARS